MPRISGIAGAEIPYFNMMKKAMPGPAKERTKKFKNHRLTEIDPKTQKPRLKRGVNQIEEMKVTIANLQARVKKLEDWQE